MEFLTLTEYFSHYPILLYNKVTLSACLKPLKELQLMLDVLAKVCRGSVSATVSGDIVYSLLACSSLQNAGINHLLLRSCLNSLDRELCEHAMFNHRTSVAFDLSTLRSDSTCLAGIALSTSTCEKAIHSTCSYHVPRVGDTSKAFHSRVLFCITLYKPWGEDDHHQSHD
jgi:hypothetical protein